MSLLKDIQRLTDKIASIYVFDGIQPSEIADAIFDKEYSSIKIDKTNHEVILIASFTEEDPDFQTSQSHSFKYIYNKNKKLQSIYQKIGNGRYKQQWSRSEELNSLIELFVSKSSNLLSRNQIDQILSTLPSDLTQKMYRSLKLVA